MALSEEQTEYRLLASLIQYPEYVLKVSPDLFTSERSILCRAMQACYTRYGELSYEGVERFYEQPLPQQFIAAHATRPDALIERLALLSEKRQLVSITIELDKLVNKPLHTMEQVRDALQFKPVLAANDTSLTYGIAAFTADLQKKRSGNYKFLSTGLKFLDYMVGGEWERQGLTVILGNGGAGKTALVCNSMLNMALSKTPTASLFISLEMTKPKLVARMVASHKEIDGLQIRKGDVTDEDIEKINESIRELNKLPMYIDDRPGLTVSEIVRQMRTHKEIYNTDVVFVDYLQIVAMQQSENMSEALGAVAQQIRNAAVELDMAAVILSQQNRDNAYRGLASILGSGRVGHIADVVFEIRAEDTNNDSIRVCTLDVHKNRSGPLGSCSVIYEPKYLRFSDS